MKPSKYNVFSKLRDSDKYFLINPLWGSADILDEKTALAFDAGSPANMDECIQKGYWVDEEAEERLFKRKYLDFLDERDNAEIQIFFVPRYACNFACSYCYQKDYAAGHLRLTNPVIDAFFSHVDWEFRDRPKYITLFGGEPLLPGNEYRRALEYFLHHCAERNLDLAVVTNGYHLAEYLPILEIAKIREIQVTLDGTEPVHNSRRGLLGGGPTFGRVVAGVDAAMARGHAINLRMVVDKENIESLPDLARFAGDKGWTTNPKFKTQLGRNYELHFCQDYQSRLFSRIELYEKIYSLVRVHPEILEFHRPAFSAARFLFDNGELPAPLFDSCPGCKTEWAFDSAGRIYSCTASVGKEGEALGTFYPEEKKDPEKIHAWQERDVLSIPQCRDCAVSLLCGGGCASVSKNKTGNLNAPDCRPVKELLALGLPLYFSDDATK